MLLQICHEGYEEGQAKFVVVSGDDVNRKEVARLPFPAAFPVETGEGATLATELKWYLEHYLEYPKGPYADRAEKILAALKDWGQTCFEALFNSRNATIWYQKAREEGLERLELRVASDDPDILSWPWEALHDPADQCLAHRCRLERQIIHQADPLPLSSKLPKDRLNILLVIARPFPHGVGYHTVARPIIDLAGAQNNPVNIEVLRPPTFDQLCAHLAEKKNFYHIVHFDGHGGYGHGGEGAAGFAPGRDRFHGRQGMLAFENDRGDGPDWTSAGDISQLLAEYRIPIMVLNASQSAMIDDQAEGVFSSVATALLRAGVHSVVAMSYSLYVQGARHFVPAFYQRLFAYGDMGEAVRAGRQEMLDKKMRVTTFGEYEFHDWLVPVLYQQTRGNERVLPLFDRPQKAEKGQAAGSKKVAADRLPSEAAGLAKEEFIGREEAIQRLEKAFQRQKQAGILIHGLAGEGKTTLAKGFLKWLADTGYPMHQAFWFQFDDIKSGEYIINRLAEELFGVNAMAAPLETKVKALAEALRENPFVLVWDNFESASGLAGTEIRANLSESDREMLKDFLLQLRGGRSKVLITSRGREEWLSDKACFPLNLEGLRGEELWEYCQSVVDDLGLTLRRDDKDLLKLFEFFGGNPLLIKALLSRLREFSPAALLEEIQKEFKGLEDDESGRRVQAIMAVFSCGLPAEIGPILQLIGLHELFVDRYFVETMLKSSGQAEALGHLKNCFANLETAGLCHHCGQNIYQMHPLLRSSLSGSYPASQAAGESFVDFMGSFADSLAPKPLHEQRFPFHIHKSNFYRALELANRLNMDIDAFALMQGLASFAQNSGNYEEARQLYEEIGARTKQKEDYESEAISYHQLGRIAQERRDFAAAEEWYKKSLDIEGKQGNEHGAASYHQLGRIAEERRDFAAAEEWYKKSLDIEEKQGNEHGAASSYHQLGRIAQERRDFTAAEEWYKKSLDIEEKQGNEHGAAITYHQLGRIAEERRDFVAAEEWYKKSLAVFEKQGGEHGAANSYHQLGMIAQERRDFAAAEEWHKKSLAIKEKQGGEHGAANSYHQLGMIAQARRDFAAAEEWYKKSLAVFEKQGNEHGAASSYHQLGNLHVQMNNLSLAGQCFIKAVKAFQNTNDEHNMVKSIRGFIITLKEADASTGAVLRGLWEESGLGTILPLAPLEKALEENKGT